MTTALMEAEERRQLVIRESEDMRYKLTEQIRRLEDHIEKQKYDRSYKEIDADAKIKAKDLQNTIFREEIELLESFLCEAISKFKILNFEKNYLQVESRSAMETLNRMEQEMKRFLPQPRQPFTKQRPKTIFKKNVRAILFALRIKKTS